MYDTDNDPLPSGYNIPPLQQVVRKPNPAMDELRAGPVRSCVFCAIVAGDADATVVARYSDAMAIVPHNPVTPGHVLIIPRRHTPDAAYAPEITAATFRAAARYAAGHSDQFNLITSAGPDATQTVFHLHVHYVPRSAGDGLTLPWTGQVKG